MTVAVALFLIAHAAIHVLFVTPRPPQTADGPPWPFELESLSVPPGPVGVALVAVTLAGFWLGALALLGLLPASILVPSVVVGACASIALLGLFFHRWLVIGIAIDIALVVLALRGLLPV